MLLKEIDGNATEPMRRKLRTFPDHVSLGQVEWDVTAVKWSEIDRFGNGIFKLNFFSIHSIN